MRSGRWSSASCWRTRAGDAIPGTGGLRKLRVAFAQRGKRGPARTISPCIAERGRVYVLLAYAKTVQETIAGQQKAALRALVGALRREGGAGDGA